MKDQFDYNENKSKFKDVEINRDSLKESGINILTGEACAMSMRLLCELTPEAMRRYLQYTGIHIKSPFLITREYDCGSRKPTADPLDSIIKSGWNDSNKYSVFLTRNSIKDLMIMWLLESQETVFYVCEGNNQYLYAGKRSDIKAWFNHFKESYGYINENGKYIKGKYYKVGRSYDLGEGPKRGFSNVHAMSGASQ